MKTPAILLSSLAAIAISACGNASHAESSNVVTDTIPADSVATVYYISDITPDNLIKIYEALGRKAEGNKVGVKISTGESNKSNHLDTALIKDFVTLINGTFIECNTAYAGNRNTTEAHRKAAEEHGFTAIAPVDIMDADGDTILPVAGGYHIEKDIVGKNFMNYDFLVVLSHFKGHQMGGFGGALKNISIGIASSAGKAWIHSAGQTDDPTKPGKIFHTEQNAFLESMADACQAIAAHVGDKVLYINVANRLSIDCDCNGNPEEPQMGDLGIFASLDPVALDRACVDAVYNSTDPGKTHLIERMEQMNGTHLIDCAEHLGVGTQKYTLVTLE